MAPGGGCMQGWFLLAGLQWIPPCWPLRHQFPNSSIGNDFKYIINRLSWNWQLFHFCNIIKIQSIRILTQLSNYVTSKLHTMAFVNPLKQSWPSWSLEAVWHFYQACRGQESEEIHRLQPVNVMTKIQYCHSHFANRKPLLCKYSYQFADICHITMSGTVCRNFAKPCYLILSIIQCMIKFVNWYWLI